MLERSSVVLSRGPLVLRVSGDGDGHLICLYGELDLSTAELLDGELRRLEKTDGGRIVLDLSGLGFLDSSGLRVLLQARRRTRRTGGELTLLRGRPEVQRVFEMTATDAILRFED